MKHHQGKLREINDAIAVLPELTHGMRAGNNNQAHRDAFDRMLAAQVELDRLVACKDLTTEEAMSLLLVSYTRPD